MTKSKEPIHASESAPQSTYLGASDTIYTTAYAYSVGSSAGELRRFELRMTPWQAVLSTHPSSLHQVSDYGLGYVTRIGFRCGETWGTSEVISLVNTTVKLTQEAMVGNI